MKAKTLRHNLERTWRRSCTHLDRSRYKHQCHVFNRMMTKAKSKYSADVISENSDKSRRLWNPINNILHIIPPPALPEFTVISEITFWPFQNCTIRSKFQIKYRIHNQCKKTRNIIRSKMNVFERATEDENKKLILSSLSKSCDLDHIPTSVLKNCLIITPIFYLQKNPDP